MISCCKGDFYNIQCYFLFLKTDIFFIRSIYLCIQHLNNSFNLHSLSYFNWVNVAHGITHNIDQEFFGMLHKAFLFAQFHPILHKTSANHWRPSIGSLIRFTLRFRYTELYLNAHARGIFRPLSLRVARKTKGPRYVGNIRACVMRVNILPA